MKKIVIVFMLLCSCSVMAQQQYITQKDIRYYNEKINAADNYISAQCRLDLYYPKNKKHFPTIIWFHGGGIVSGHKEIPQALMDKGYAVAGVGYRFSPKVHAPAYIEDAAAAVAWVFRHIAEYGGDSSLIFVSGHSAGAYLSMMITLDKKYLAKYNVNADDIAALIPFSGQTVTHFTVRKERGMKDTQPVIDEYAPLYHVRADAPPIMLITGDRNMEMLARYEENAYLLQMLRIAGHKHAVLYELQGFNHGNMPQPAFPLLLQEVAAISKAIDHHK